jgi:hypothetical protein
MHTRKMVLTTALLVTVIALQSTALATSTLPGWTLTATNETIFVGDPINLTVSGPTVNVTVELDLYDTNTTLVRTYYPYYYNGTATYNFTTSLDDGPGAWYIVMLVDQEQAASLYIKVVYDENNFLLKRIAIQDTELTRLQGLTNSLIADTHQLHEDIHYYQATYPIVLFIVIFGTIVAYRYAFFPLWIWKLRMRIDFVGYGKGWRGKIEDFMAMPWSGSEQAQFHARRRSQKPQRWPEEAIAIRSTTWGSHMGLIKIGPVKKTGVSK